LVPRPGHRATSGLSDYLHPIVTDLLYRPTLHIMF
jgi:hypothetical protein